MDLYIEIDNCTYMNSTIHQWCYLRYFILYPSFLKCLRYETFGACIHVSVCPSVPLAAKSSLFAHKIFTIRPYEGSSRQFGIMWPPGTWRCGLKYRTREFLPSAVFHVNLDLVSCIDTEKWKNSSPWWTSLNFIFSFLSKTKSVCLFEVSLGRAHIPKCMAIHSAT